MTKKCPTCCRHKEIEDFAVSQKTQKLHYKCISCEKYERAYYQKNKDKIIKRSNTYYKDNRIKCRKAQKRYWENNRKELYEKSKIWNKANAEKVKRYSAKTRRSQKRKKWMSEWRKNKRKTDIGFRIALNLRKRIWDALFNNIKSDKSMILIGCSIEQLIKHLESQFKSGMTWENYGMKGWHIDHILPCASFDLARPEEQKRCFHYTNLQPLWAIENIKKKDKII